MDESLWILLPLKGIASDCFSSVFFSYQSSLKNIFHGSTFAFRSFIYSGAYFIINYMSLSESKLNEDENLILQSK